jgi:hypothetical protein
MKSYVFILFFLLPCGLLRAQNQQADVLQQQFHNYQTNTLQEKLFVHTDKTFYLAGETIWFKLYAIDASFHKPLMTSVIAYTEILNKDLKPVLQTKVHLLNGCGSGSVTIPGFLPTGNYIFRAYTSWMKNYSPDFYFENTIHIVNTLRVPVANPSLKSPVSIQFFPEGGNAVAGIAGKVAFKVTDGEGQGLDCTGLIINQINDTVTRFQTLHNGMGNFQLKQEKNSSYYAVLKLNDSLFKQKLPDALLRGFTMNVTDEESGKFKIIVRATPEFNNTPVYLLSQTRQVIKNLQADVIKDGESVFLVDKKDLGDGISGITLFDQLRQPVCERLVFKRPQETFFIQTSTDQPVYSTRKPVNIDLATRSSNGLPLSGNLSLSVFMIDSLQHVPGQNIISWLFLSSDLKGRIETPGYYFTNPDNSVDAALDNLLLTQGWRRFKWKDVFETRNPSFEFLPELEGPVVNGKVINKLTGTPVAATGALLSVPGIDYAFSSATSDGQGNIRFGLKDIYKNNAIVVQPAQLKDSNYRIDITNTYSDKFSSYTTRSLTLSKSQENELLSRSIGNQVENTYGVDKKRRYIKVNPDTTSFYGRPDRAYNLDDFTRFQTMEEVMREYIEDVRVRKEGEKFNFKVRNKLFNTYFEENPLILLDGIPISDASKIIALEPQKVRRIEVVTHRYYIGSSAFDGIVNVKSYTGEIGATQIDPNSLVVEFEGLQQQREFYSPQYSSRESAESHMPDFRNVLYWVPQIITGTDGKSRLSFYTSDLKGKFAIVVQGLTKEGLPGNTVSFFEVKSSN